MSFRLALAAAFYLGAVAVAVADAPKKSMPLKHQAEAPKGWLQFCADYPKECLSGQRESKVIVMTPTTWGDLRKVNRWVNETVEPLSDPRHWSKVESWNLPTDGYGDCEDYVLLKRKMLIDAGWPRQALLITTARRDNDTHAVLTVVTDEGDFVLDNFTHEILPWHKTGFLYFKRQWQTDENVWVWIDADLRQE
ncbi:transglutaminase-like cysteine peptidase [Bradyrhizobium sp. U531]|uniref:transglutaminase-like cysteine peptidase n=1 Tax=Bradyrhizobium sp. U531 TaxID=3053458 RepID=UPI003F41D414